MAEPINSTPCDYCKDVFPRNLLEEFKSQLYCQDCLPEVVDQYEEYQEYLSNQD